VSDDSAQIARPEPVPAGAVVAVLAAGIAILLWAGRGTLFTIDDLLWFMSSPGLDLEGALQPHNGHLIATSRVLYHLVFEALGADYLAIRLLTALAAGGSALLFFVWARRRVADTIALAGMVLLLLLGSSYVFLIAGDGLMVHLSVCAGIGVLLALERRDLAGDVAACGLLCLGVVTYSLALPFVVAAAVAVYLGEDRVRRAFVPVVPALLYGAWWVWSQDLPNAPGDGADMLNLLVLPAYAFQTLSSALGALTGLDHDFAGEMTRPEFAVTTSFAGPVLAALAIGAFAWRLRRPVPTAAWVALGLLVSLWMLGAVTTDAASPPDASRFVYFFAVPVLLVGVACAAGMRWTRGRVIAVWAVAACGLAANLLFLIDGGEYRRDVDARQLRAELTAFELAGENAAPHPDLSGVAGGNAVLNYPFELAPLDDPSGDYVSAAQEYGALGFPVGELRAETEETRARTDAALAAAYEPSLAPHAEPTAGCERHRAEGGASAAGFELPAEGAVIEIEDAPAPVELRRFADETWVPVGTLEPGAPGALAVPADDAPDPWQVSVGAASALVCPFP
jgi:hypothetical protein